MEKKEVKIVLASASPRRRELLRSIADDFLCISPDVDEVYDGSLPPEKIAMYLAKIKCEAVAKNYPDYAVIGSDTVVHLDGEILGKPIDKEDAKRMMRLLSGKIHDVITGVCLAYDGKIHLIHSITKVEFKHLSNSVIERYVATSEPFDKAGGYGIQGQAKEFVQGFSGDFNNVVGFPLDQVSKLLCEVGVLKI